MDNDEKIIITFNAPIEYFLFSDIRMFGLVCAGIGLVIALIQSYSFKIKITNKRIEFRLGLLSHTQVITELAKIYNIEYEQSLFGRIFDFGIISFKSFDGKKLAFPIKSPQIWLERIRDEVRKETGEALVSTTLRSMMKNLNK